MDPIDDTNVLNEKSSGLNSRILTSDNLNYIRWIKGASSYKVGNFGCCCEKGEKCRWTCCSCGINC